MLKHALDSGLALANGRGQAPPVLRPQTRPGERSCGHLDAQGVAEAFDPVGGEVGGGFGTGIGLGSGFGSGSLARLGGLPSGLRVALDPPQVHTAGSD